MADKINFYYFAITVIVVCLFVLWFYTKTPFGSLVVGIRDNAMRIDYLGFKLPQIKAVNLIVSGAFAGIAGTFLSLFAVRLRGHYLAIASLGFAVIVHQILLNWISLTQGPLGIYGIAPPPAIVIGGVVVADFRNLAAFFYLVAGFAFLSYILLSQLVRSPIGETLTAIREDEVSAASLGINGAAWKVFAFGVGSAVAGAAGCFYASFVGTLVPDAFFVSARRPPASTYMD